MVSRILKFPNKIFAAVPKAWGTIGSLNTIKPVTSY